MRRRRHLNLDHLESFIALADCHGITAAAKKINRAQPTVSQHLQRLERQLSRQLITRGRGGASLTVEGRRILPLARGLLRLNGQLTAEDSSLPLRLGACSNIGIYLLPELLTDLRTRGHELPELAIGANPEIMRRLHAQELDIALVEWWETHTGYESRIWRYEPVVAILPPDHPLAERDSVSIAELRRVPLLGGESGTGTGRLLRTYLGRRKEMQVAMNLGSTEAVKRAVAAGLGASLVLQLSVAEHLLAKEPDLVVRPLVPALHKPLHLVWRSDLPAQHQLLEYLKSAAHQQIQIPRHP